MSQAVQDLSVSHRAPVIIEFDETPEQVAERLGTNDYTVVDVPVGEGD
jgi:hypothetical protein